MVSNMITMPISIYALGGLCEVGKNTYCIESEKDLILIDAGVMFPGAELPGIDYVIPDFSHLKKNRAKIKALFITHGHEDHIGAIPFLVQSVNIPVIYAPKLAASLIRNKLQENRIRTQVKIVEYTEDDVIMAGEFKVQFFHVTHSIPDSFGICVDTPEGRIVTTGDFKVDLTPVGPDINLRKMAMLGNEGIDLLMADSTNAEIEGYTPSEKNVISSINDVFAKAPGRLIISTFSSNISRIQQIVEACIKYKKKIVIIGRSMENAVSAARSFGYIKIPDAALISADNIKTVSPNETVILCTGSQGEPMAALSRIANGEHKTIRIIPGDTVVFSSSPIPGNGAFINKVINQLTRVGANVLTNSVFYSLHSSGHPSRQELRIVQKLFMPKYFMPIHGEYRMLRIHADIAVDLGMPRDHTFIMSNGDTLLLKNHEITRGPRVQADDIYIDGRDINGLSASVIHDRKVLSEDGMVAVCLVIDSRTNKIMAKPAIYTRGFVRLTNNTLIEKAQIKIENTLTELMKNKVTFGEIKSTIKQTLSRYFFAKTQRNPYIIPVIMNKN